MTDNEFLLVDRISAINATDEKWDLQKNGYISFSGGKDSTILHYLFDEALPGNRIPRVFIDTGIEYAMIREFVLEMASHDDRFQIIKPTKPIKQILETYGYPFKSKEHSLRVDQFNKGHNSNYISKYIGGYSYGGKKSRFTCPSCLLYQFEEKGKYNFSNLCCAKLKKQPVKQWERANGRRIAITGMRAEEGGNRARLGCAIFKGGKLIHFHPLIKVSDDWEDWFVREREVHLCPLYSAPYNFKRTGCKGCPFALDLQQQLTTMLIYLPNERKQCELIWKYVYDEYRRIGYRLDQFEQLKLF